MAFGVGFITRNRCSKQWLHHPEPLLETVAGIAVNQIQHRLLRAALGDGDLYLAAALFAEQFLKRLQVLEFRRDVNQRRHVLLVEIDLLQQGSQKLRLLEALNVFPIELAAIDDTAIAQVEQVGGHQGRLGEKSEDIDVAAFDRGHALPLL